MKPLAKEVLAEELGMQFLRPWGPSWGDPAMLAMIGFTVTRAVVIVVAGSLLRVKGLRATHDLFVRNKFLFSRSENILFLNFLILNCGDF